MSDTLIDFPMTRSRELSTCAAASGAALNETKQLSRVRIWDGARRG